MALIPPMPGMMPATQMDASSQPSPQGMPGQYPPPSGTSNSPSDLPAVQSMLTSYESLRQQCEAFASQFPQAADEVQGMTDMLALAMKKLMTALVTPPQPGPAIPM